MKLAFIGAGKMAAAIARGALRAGLCQTGDVLATARTENTRTAFATAVGLEAGAVKPATDNTVVAASSDVVLLCVKPPDVIATLRKIAPKLRSGERGQLVISVAAGTPISELQTAAGIATPLVRVMPNTPALIGKGASAFARGPMANDTHAALVEKIFGALGDIHAVDEKLIDAVNGLSASGPAYIYTVIEALADGGVLMGLPRPLAAALATQTVLGSAELVKQSAGQGQHPAQLRDAVASAGGTTMAGMEALENGGLRAALIAAVRAATERARSLGRGEPP